MYNSLIVIPARWQSSRLPGKPLRNLAGKPLIQWVIEAALKVPNADGILVATDNKLVAACADELGVMSEMTDINIRNGTERLLSVIHKYSSHVYINLQCDEPLASPHDISECISILHSSKDEIVSLMHSISGNMAQDPNRVKVVFSEDKRALYFSREPIPHNAQFYWQHVGIYGFKSSILDELGLLAPTSLECLEGL